jgi:guanylate kinase
LQTELEDENMTKKSDGRLVVFSGPSCVGKSPLAKALARLHPALYKSLQPLVIYNSRSARPGETEGVDYYFRPRKEIENLHEKEDFIVMDVRGDLQALDLQELKQSLTKGDVFFEGNPFVGNVLLTHPFLAEVNRLSVFMSPLSQKEILFLKAARPAVSIPDLVTDVMRRKLLRRTRKQKGEISLKDLENIERRASSAYAELLEAHNFQYVIPNHDGEDCENWDAFYYPLGDAGMAFNAFVCLLKHEKPSGVEFWEKDLFS